MSFTWSIRRPPERIHAVSGAAGRCVDQALLRPGAVERQDEGARRLPAATARHISSAHGTAMTPMRIRCRNAPMAPSYLSAPRTPPMPARPAPTYDAHRDGSGRLYSSRLRLDPQHAAEAAPAVFMLISMSWIEEKFGEPDDVVDDETHAKVPIHPRTTAAITGPHRTLSAAHAGGAGGLHPGRGGDLSGGNGFDLGIRLAQGSRPASSRSSWEGGDLGGVGRPDPPPASGWSWRAWRAAERGGVGRCLGGFSFSGAP